MNKFKDFIKKSKYLIIVLAIFIVGITSFAIKKSFGASTEKTYTREELQKMIVSAAISYYWNNMYSDYEQYTLDFDTPYPAAKDGTNTNNTCIYNYKDYQSQTTKCISKYNNYPLVSTTLFRNLKITPEEVGRSNMYNTDCTGFTYLVYNNVLGYDLSEFYSLFGTTNIVRINSDGTPSKKRAVTSKTDYTDVAIDKFSRAWSTNGNLTRITNCIVHNNGDREKCSFNTTLSDTELEKYNIGAAYSKKGEVYTDKNNKSEIVFNYNFSQTTSDEYLKEWENIKANFIKGDNNIMQPGDMIKIAYPSNGHVMVYIGDALNTADSGFIHSWGADGSWDSKGIRYENSVYYFLNNKIKDFQNGKNSSRITSLTVFRPINIYCSKNSGKETCSDNKISSNDEARVAFSGTKAEQYIAKDDRVITSYNSVAVGDTITYHLNINDRRNYGYCSDSSKGKGNCECKDTEPNCGRKWYTTGSVYETETEEKKKYTIKFFLPKGTTMKDSEHFNYDKEENGYKVYKYTGNGYTYHALDVTIDSSVSSKIEPGIFEITYNGSTLTLKTIELNVNSTISSNAVDELKTTINEFTGKTYSSTGQITSKEKFKTATAFSSLDFIKYIYLKNFNIDLSYLNGTKIVDSLFYSWNTEASITNDNKDYKYKVSAFFKKDDTSDINKMLVDGMYGGKKLIGNENEKRIKYIHHRNFEIGDIIVVSDKTINSFDHSTRVGNALNFSLTEVDQKQGFKYYLVSGFEMVGEEDKDDKEKYPVLVRFSSSGLETCDGKKKVFDGKDNYLIESTTATKCSPRVIKHLLFSSNIFAVLRPTQLYPIEYNLTIEPDGGTYSGDTSVKVTYGKTYTLKTPTKTGYTFENWKVTAGAGSSVNKNTFTMGSANATVKAVWQANEYTLTIDAAGGTYSGDTSVKVTYGKTYTLSTPSKTGYTFVKWQVSGTGSSINGNTFTMGSANATVKAVWQANEYTLTVDPNGGTYSGDTSVKVAYGKTYTLSTPTKTGYTFVKWEVSGTGSSINGNTFTMGNADATVKAIWKENDRLTFDSTLSVDADNKMIYNIKPNTIMSDIISKTSTNGTVVLYDNEDNVIEQSHAAGTGCVISFKFENNIINYVSVVNGDVTGDGRVTLLDLSNTFKENKKKTNNFDKYMKKAIDFDNNNIFNANDVSEQIKYYRSLKRK